MSSDKSKKSGKTLPREIKFFAYPKLLFTWPIIFMGVFLWLLDILFVGNINAEIAGWTYIWTCLFVIVAMGIDLERNYAIFWLVVISAITFLGMFLHEKEILLYANIYTIFADLDIKYDFNLGLAISILLAVPFCIMLVWSRLSHRWRITHNEFELYSFGRRDLSLARGAKTVRSSYPDWLELIICLSGTLIVFDARGAKVLRRIENVPFLPFVRKKINRILETTSVTSDAMFEDIEDSDGGGDEEDSTGQDVSGVSEESAGEAMDNEKL